MAVLFHRFSPGWLPGGKRVRGARWKVWGETEMLFSGPGILPTEDTSAAASLCKERPARHCLWGSLRRLLFRGWWVAMRPVLQQLYSQDIFLFVGMTPPTPKKSLLKEKETKIQFSGPSKGCAKPNWEDTAQSLLENILPRNLARQVGVLRLHIRSPHRQSFKSSSIVTCGVIGQILTSLRLIFSSVK